VYISRSLFVYMHAENTEDGVDNSCRLRDGLRQHFRSMGSA
jgi:hypothetical protein